MPEFTHGPETDFNCDYCFETKNKHVPARVRILSSDIPDDGNPPTDDREYTYACTDCAIVHGHVIAVKAHGVYSVNDVSWFETAAGRFTVGDIVRVRSIARLGTGAVLIRKIHVELSGAVNVTVWPLGEHENAYAIVSGRFIRKDA